MRAVMVLMLLCGAAVAAPSVTITFPDPEITKIEGPIPLGVTATTTTGRVSAVRFYIDGTLLVEQPGPATKPAQSIWQFFGQRWDSRLVANGTHTLVIQAKDSTGLSTMAMRSFVVDNTQQGCIQANGAGGDAAAINAALASTKRAVLCPYVTYYLLDSIKLGRAGSIYTMGFPTDDGRARLVLNTSAASTAIDGRAASFAFIRSVQVIGPDGGGPALEFNPITGKKDEALIRLGGWASNQFVDASRIQDTRSWSLVHLFEGGCNSAMVTRNEIGPASYSRWPVYTPDAPTPVADGLSFACQDSIVTDNTVFDVTDGAIVVFGAPGTQVARNTVTSFTRILLGAIHTVAGVTYGGDYSGTRVELNTVDAKWGILAGIAVGPNTWTCKNVLASDTTAVHGGAILNNSLTGPNMGYGIAVNGVRDWIISGNTSTATHGGTPGHTCDRPQASPLPFLVYTPNVATVSLQSEFVSGRVEELVFLTLPHATFDRILFDGSPISLPPAAAGTDVYYDFYIPPGTTRYNIAIAGGSGDADLYVRRDVPPTATLYDCRPYTGTSAESCSATYPLEGHYYVMVRAYTDYAGVTLTATRSAALTSGVSVQNVRGLKGTPSRYFSIAIPSGTHTLTTSTAGGPGDVDIYVSRTNPTPDTSPADCGGTSSTATESCSITVTGPSTAYIAMRPYADYVRTQLTATVSP